MSTTAETDNLLAGSDNMSFKETMSNPSYKAPEVDKELGDRLKELLALRDMTVSALAGITGLDKALLRRLRNGVARWNTWHMKKIADGLEIQVIDLFKSSDVITPQLTIQKPSNHFERYFDETFSKQHYIPIRLLDGAVAAGPAGEVREKDIQSWVLIYADRRWLPHDPDHYSCVYVRGDSMYPILSDGDIVAIDHVERDPAKLDGKIVAFRVDGGVTIKWLKHDPKRKVVVGIPENHDRLDVLVTLRGDEIDAGIVGKVAWWWAKR